MTMGTILFVFLLFEAMRDVLTLLVSKSAGIGAVFVALGLLLPFLISFVTPMAALLAVILVVSRLSNENELTAMRAGGVSLVSVSLPLLVSALVLCGFSAWMNLELAPKSRVVYKQLLLDAGLAKPTELLEEGRFIREIPGYVVYIGKRSGSLLEDVLLFQYEEGELVRKISSEKGEVSFDEDSLEAQLDLVDAVVSMKIGDTWQVFYAGEASHRIQVAEKERTIREPKISEMSFTQLADKRWELEHEGIDASPVKVHQHRQLAMSFACLSFVLIGIPLSLGKHRKDKLSGGASALVAMLVYQGGFIMAQSFETRTELSPWLIGWVPVIALQLIGGLLLLRANRGSA